MHGDVHAWAVARGISPFHPAEWSAADRDAYFLAFDWAAPYSDVYRSCACHPHGFARYQDDDVSDKELDGYVADDPVWRGRYSREAARAFAYLERWSHAYQHSQQAAARLRVLAAQGRRA